MSRADQKSIGFAAEGGMATTRVKAPATAEQVNALAAVHADALAYLVRTGNADVAAALGLVAPPKRTKPTRSSSARPCAVCQTPFLPARGSQICCSRSCGGKHAHDAAKTTTGGKP